MALLLVLCSTAAFTVGRLLAPPDRDKLSAAQDAIEVFAAVESRVVQDQRTFPGKVSEGAEADLLPTSGGMVVRRVVSVGDTLGFGTLAGIVSGRPIFFIAAPLPLYRDLGRGDIGDDVLALQNSLSASGLSISVTGEVDYQTLSALEELYARNGLERTWFDPIAAGDFVWAPGPGVVTQVADLGTTLGDEQPLVTVRYAAPLVTVRVDAITALDLQLGAEMLVRTKESELIGVVTSIGSFSEGAEGEKPGHDLTIAAQSLESLIGSPVTVSLRTDDQEASLAVPITSIREDSEGTYVLRQDEDALERVGVNILRSDGGWVAVRSGDLKERDRVRVSQ